MKVATKNNTVLLQGDVESVEMTLSKRGIVAATRMFRDQIYTHKAWAVVREIIANAVDEHAKHNIARPVLVTLPTAADPHFRVRDFAKGLSKEKVFAVFFQYFESTKDQDNDGIGGFGIGAKSPLAYANMFFVDSYHGGEKTSYVANINGEASTAHKMDLQDSSETGIEVAVPVEASDFEKFARLVGELLHFSDWNVEIKDGKELPKPESKWEVETKYGKIGYPQSQFKSNSNIYAHIKGILYAVDSTSEIVNPFYQQVVLHFDGSDEIEINPSRERIELTKRNIVKINARMEDLKNEILSSIQDQMKHATCARDRFAINSCASVFKGSHGLNKVVPQTIAPYLDDVECITWDQYGVERIKGNRMLSKRYVSQAHLTPDGFQKEYGSYQKNSSFIQKGNIVLVGGLTLRSECAIAFAEKNNISSPVFFVRHDAAPELWVEGKDFWRMTEDSVTKDEAKAVRDRLFKRAAKGTSTVTVAGSEIMGYDSIRRHHWQRKELDTLKQENKKYLLVSMNENDQLKHDLKNHSACVTGRVPLFVFDSKLPLWKKSGLDYEVFSKDKFKTDLESYLAGDLVLDLKNGLSLSLVPRDKTDKYLGKKDFNSSVKQALARHFSDLQPKTPKSILQLWENAQKRFDALAQEEREMVALSANVYINNYPALKAKGEKLIKKVFV